MTTANHQALSYTPTMLGRINSPPPSNDESKQAHDLLEEAIVMLLRRHCPSFVKIDGPPIRYALARAFVRFMLERAGGNQARAAENAGLNRNTLRRLCRVFSIPAGRAAH